MTYAKPVVLILGATGRTGSHLVNLLERETDSLEIRVAIRKPEQAEQFLQRSISTVHLDLDDLSTYEAALRKSFIVHGYYTWHLNFSLGKWQINGIKIHVDWATGTPDILNM